MCVCVVVVVVGINMYFPIPSPLPTPHSPITSTIQSPKIKCPLFGLIAADFYSYTYYIRYYIYLPYLRNPNFID